jgi:very-short-patch-repair endonuclease
LGEGEARSLKILRSRQLRIAASDAEQKLWHHLRRKHVNGLRFRRQFPLGPYFTDFVCLSARLVVEVDGGQHGLPRQQAHDGRRTAWLEANGFRVIRFWADEVMANTAAVLDGIEAALREPLPQGIARARSLAPSRKGRGNTAVVQMDNPLGDLPPSFRPCKGREKKEAEAPK